MKGLKTVLAAVVVFGVMALSAYGAQVKTPAELLQEGIYAEETEGNLNAAIEKYEQVLGHKRAYLRTSAQATYRIGMCYLKKGEKDAARKYFKEAVDKYPKQRSVVVLAQAELDKLGPATARGGVETSLWEELPGAVMQYIGSKYGSISAEAGGKNLYSNSPIYYVNGDFVVKNGGMGYYYNRSTSPTTGRVRLSGTTDPNQTLYDTAGRQMKTEILPDQGRKGFYDIYWTPAEPVAPGQFFMYGWSMNESRILPPFPKASKRALKMQNTFGNRVMETFFLVVPTGMGVEVKEVSYEQEKYGLGVVNEKGEVEDPRKKYIEKETIAGFDVYYWKHEIAQNWEHVVEVMLTYAGEAAGKEISAADKLQSENLSREGWTLWQQRKLAEAEAKFKAAVELDPKNENGWQGLGWAQFNQGKSLNAKDSFEKCIALNPKNSAALNGLGWIANAKGDKDEAIKWWEKAVGAQPGATASLSGLTQVYMERGHYEKAAKYYRMWLSAEPDNKDVKEGLVKAEKAASRQREALEKALPAAEHWLALVDEVRYGESWQAAAGFFKKMVTKEQWETAVGMARKPFGKLISRQVSSTAYTTTAPGAPDGEYVIITFNASYENKKDAIETVTPMLDSDGKWRVSGYFVK